MAVIYSFPIKKVNKVISVFVRNSQWLSESLALSLSLLMGSPEPSSVMKGAMEEERLVCHSSDSLQSHRKQEMRTTREHSSREKSIFNRNQIRSAYGGEQCSPLIATAAVEYRKNFHIQTMQPGILFLFKKFSCKTKK